MISEIQTGRQISTAPKIMHARAVDHFQPAPSSPRLTSAGSRHQRAALEPSASV